MFFFDIQGWAVVVLPFFLQYCNVCSMVIPYTSIVTVTTQAITWGPVSTGNCKEQYSLSFSSKNLSWSHERNARKCFHVQLTNEDFSTSEPSKSTCLQGSFVRIPCCETTGNERPHYPCVPCPTIDFCFENHRNIFGCQQWLWLEGTLN